MEGKVMKKRQNLSKKKNHQSSDSQSIQEPSSTSGPPKDHQHSHEFIQDEFICGGCRLSSPTFWAFLLHKLEHAVSNGLRIPCCFCQSTFKSAKSVKCHYKYFHNILSETSEISPNRRRGGSVSSKDVQDTVLKPLDEINKSIKKPLKRKRKSAARIKCITSVKEATLPTPHSGQEKAQSAGENSLNNTQTCLQSLSPKSVSEGDIRKDGESQSLDDSQNTNSRKRFKAMTEGLQTKTPLRNEASSVTKAVVPNTRNVLPKPGDCSSKVPTSDPGNQRISLSAASLAKIKKLASIAAARNKTMGKTQKILIVCKPDKPGVPDLQTKAITKTVEDKENSDMKKTDRVPSSCRSKSDLVGPNTSPCRTGYALVDNPVDVTKFEKDFLFQLGMRESGKSVKYMREVYRCVYCDTFEKCCLDLLITHMKDCHKDEVMERCPSDVVRSANVKLSVGMTSLEVISFQVYRSKLLARKTKDEERKSLLKKEKGLPRHLIGLPCLYCSKRFTTTTKLQAHMDRHLNVKRFLCEECGRSFRSWHLLRSHKKDHLNASYGKIKCAFCSFQSGDTSALNRHYRIHPKKSHLCHICGNMYSSLRKHVKVHSQDRPYPCPFKGCTYRFTSEVPCKIHYQAHTAHGQRFRCSKCSSRFSRKHHLLRHLTKVHQEPIDSQETLSSQIPDSTIQTSSSGLMITDGDHQFDQSTAGTEMEEFSVEDGQEGIDISEGLQ